MATSVRVPAAQEPEPGPTQRESGRLVLRATWGLVLLGIVVRAWVVHATWFTGDDYVLQGVAWRSALDSGYLTSTPTGQFMPGGLALQWPLTHGWPMDPAPLSWVLVALHSVVLAASAALLLVLLGTRRLALIPVAVVALSPAVLPAGSTWAAGLAFLPVQIALVAGLLAVALRRAERRGAAVAAVAAAVLWVAALAFSWTALVVPWICLGLAVALTPRASRPWRTAAVRLWPAWAVALLVSSAYLVLLVRYDALPDLALPDAAAAADVLGQGLVAALLPAVAGGPVDWFSSGPGLALATPPTWLVALAAEILLVLVVWSCAVSVAARRVWVWAAAVVGSVLLVGLLGPSGRAGGLAVMTLQVTALATIPLVLAASFAAAALTPSAVRLLRRAGRPDPAGALRGWVVPATGAVVILSMLSTSHYREAVADNPTQAYVAQARASLAAAADGPTLVDQAVPASMVSPLRFPYNQASWVLSPLAPQPGYGDPTTLLRILDDSGVLQPALVAGVASAPGPVPACGWLVQGKADVSLASPVVEFSHTVRVGFLAGAAASGTLAIGDGPPRAFQVSRGLSEVVITLTGGGNVLRIADVTPGVSLCTDDVRVGVPQVVPAP